MTSQTPYGGGGFPPPWLRDNSDTSGVQWGDDRPAQDSGAENHLLPAGNPWAAGGSHPTDSPAQDDRSVPVLHEPEAENAPPADEFESLVKAFTPEAGKKGRKRRAPKQPKQRSSPKTTRAPRERTSRPPRAGVSRRGVLLSMGAIAVVALIGGGGYLGYQALTSAPQEAVESVASTAPTISREVPPGWSQGAAWTVPADVASNLAVRDGYIAYLNSAGILVVAEDGTGATVFSSTPTGADPSASRVVLTRIGQTPIVAVIQSQTLTSWSLSAPDPQPVLNEIPSSSTVTSSGTGVMLVTGAETWRMNESLHLEKVEGLPQGDTSLGMTSDGSIVSGSPQGGWSTNDGTTSTKVTIEMAEGAAGSVMYPARAAKGFVVAWAPTEDRNTRVVAIYDAIDGTPVASTRMATAQVNLGLPLVVTDAGTLASVGPWLVNLDNGESETSTEWTTLVGAGSELYGKSSQNTFVWRGSGKPIEVPQDAAIPWGITDDDKAIVVSTNEHGTKVIAALNRQP